MRTDAENRRIFPAIPTQLYVLWLLLLEILYRMSQKEKGEKHKITIYKEK